MKKIILATCTFFAVNLCTSQLHACRKCITEACLNLQEMECDMARKEGGPDKFDKGYLYGYRGAIMTIYNQHPDINMTIYEYEAIFKHDRRDGDRE